jgi:hypothetical protein
MIGGLIRHREASAVAVAIQSKTGCLLLDYLASLAMTARLVKVRQKTIAFCAKKEGGGTIRPPQRDLVHVRDGGAHAPWRGAGYGSGHLFRRIAPLLAF